MLKSITVWKDKIFSFFSKYFIYLAALGLSCSIWVFSCSMWNLVSRLGIEPRPPALGAQTLTYWTTREVPEEISS